MEITSESPEAEAERSSMVHLGGRPWERRTKVVGISCRVSAFPHRQAHCKMHEIEASKRYQEHQPAGELVKEPHGFVRVPILHAQTGAEDSDHVRSDRNGQS